MICPICHSEYFPDKFHPRQMFCSQSCYKNSDHWKSIQKQHDAKPTRKEYQKQYKKLEKYKKQQKEYQKSDKMRAYRKRYEREIRNKNAKRIAYIKNSRRIKKLLRPVYYDFCKLCGDIFITSLNHPNQSFCSRKCHKIDYDRRIETKEKKRIKARKYMRTRRKNDIIFKIIHSQRHKINLLLRQDIKSASTLELLGCTPEALWSHLESQFQAGMTRNNYGRGGWHVDHKMPCVSFNLEDPEHQKKCFHYTNLQPLWEKENIKKGCRERTLYGKKSRMKHEAA